MRESEDASGHEHKGAGPDGGQFTSKGEGGGGPGKPGLSERPPGGAKRARRRAGHEQAVADYDKAYAEWEARGEERQDRKDEVEAFAEAERWPQNILDRANKVNVETDPDASDLLATEEGRGQYLARVKEYATLQVMAFKAGFGAKLAEDMEEMGFSPQAVGRVKALSGKGEAAVLSAAQGYNEAAARFVQVHAESEAWLQENPAPDPDDPGYDAWAKKDEARDRKYEKANSAAADAYEDIDAVSETWAQKINDAALPAAEKVAAEIDKEDEADLEPEEPEEPDWSEPEEEVVTAAEQVRKVVDNIETEDPDLEEELNALDDALQSFEYGDPDDHPDALEVYARAARDAAIAFNQAGDVRNARKIRQTGAAALRALKALDNEGD